jgi:aspartate/methionine/tyrosine aminotransferase
MRARLVYALPETGRRANPMQLNPHLIDTGTPPIPEAQAWLAAWQGPAADRIDLSQAVPGYPPHETMLQALSTAAGTRAAASYGSIYGDTALRDAYGAHLSQVYGAPVKPGETMITSGCNQAFIIAVMALAKAGDAILVPSPWYFNHDMALTMLGIETRALPCSAENGFVPAVTNAENLVDEKVKAIVLVTPNNPTGAIYPPDVIEAFYELCARKKIALILDETYRDFLPDNAGPAHGLFNRKDWGETLISLYSFSKSYCIPGHRIGAMIASENNAREIGKILDTLQICPQRAAQMALVPAIPELAVWREDNRREINVRAEAFRAAMAQGTGWQIASVGAYFSYVRHPYTADARVVAERLARERGVLLLPGVYFGDSSGQFMRVAFANADRAKLAALPERLSGFAL